MKNEFRILSATAILGYGFPIASFEAGLAKNPENYLHNGTGN